MSTGLLLLGSGGGSAAFSPDQVSGLILWLKADSLALNDGDAVTTWADSSSSANDVTQATAANKPTLQTNEINGKPVVRFDDVNDRLGRADDADFDFGSGNFSVFAVAKPTGSRGAIICKDNYQGADGFYVKCADNGEIGSGTLWFAYWNGSTTVSMGAVDTAFHQLAAIREGTGANQVKLYLDKTNSANTTDARTLSNALELRVGSAVNNADFFGGDIAEILVYNSALSTADRQSVETYFSSKYGI
ncbi:MAG: LamG-like jellyroll fold domain-containing protein [bacterium]